MLSPRARYAQVRRECNRAGGRPPHPHTHTMQVKVPARWRPLEGRIATSAVVTTATQYTQPETTAELGDYQQMRTPRSHRRTHDTISITGDATTLHAQSAPIPSPHNRGCRCCASLALARWGCACWQRDRLRLVDLGAIVVRSAGAQTVCHLRHILARTLPQLSGWPQLEAARGMALHKPDVQPARGDAFHVLASLPLRVTTNPCVQ